MAMEPSEIAEQLVKSGIITEEEKLTYFFNGSGEYGQSGDQGRATCERVAELVKNYKDDRTPPLLTGDTTVDSANFPTDEPLAPKTEGMPNVFVSSGDKGSSVEVSTEALTKFSENLNLLQQM